MQIKSIKNSNAKGYLKLEIDTGDGITRIIVSESQYEGVGSPAPCEIISDEDFDYLLAEDEYNRAKKRALNILAFGDNSTRELRDKLRRAGFSPKICEKLSKEMIRLGYINEERQLLRLVENEAKGKQSGPRKIMAKLAAKGYPPEKIRAAIRTLEDGGTLDFAAIKEKLTEGVADYEERCKILYKKGF